MVRLSFSSDLATPQPVVWARASSMDGVNAELMPLLRMTHPPEATDLTSPMLKLGETAFASWLLLFGFLPIDRHYLMLERLYANEGFDERSWSWMQRVWIHRRRVIAIPGGTRVTDELEFEPRLKFSEIFLRPVIRFIFQHRHKRLAESFRRINMGA
jgi:hypothetical protein